jgi:hypothetical protein
MPRYNGVLAYMFEVTLQVLWSYLLWCLLLGLVSAGFSALTGAHGEAPLFTLRQVADLTVIVTAFVFASFRYFFQPRFAYAPIVVTFVLAGIFGCVIVAFAAIISAFGETGLSVVDVPSWIVSDGVVGRYLSWAAVAIGIGGLMALGERFIGSWGAWTFGLGRWWGRLLVGRAAYDAFAETEAARLHRAYDDHVASIRK